MSYCLVKLLLGDQEIRLHYSLLWVSFAASDLFYLLTLVFSHTYVKKPCKKTRADRLKRSIFHFPKGEGSEGKESWEEVDCIKGVREELVV